MNLNRFSLSLSRSLFERNFIIFSKVEVCFQVVELKVLFVDESRAGLICWCYSRGVAREAL
jgi:hypothetical protein